MNRDLSKTWWLLTLCGVLDAAHAALNLLMLNPDGSVILRRLALPGAAWDLGMLAAVAGVCAVAAGIWNFGKDASWLLSLHGFALGGFGLIGISPLVRGPLSFRPVSLLFVVMALSIAAFALATAHSRQRNNSERWFLRVAGAVSIGFALSFFAVGFRLFRLEPQSFFLWMSSYFSFCAIFMLWLAFRVNSWRLIQPRQEDPLSSLPHPRHAH